MKKVNSSNTRHLRKALQSGFVISAAFLQANAQDVGKDWLQENLKPWKDSPRHKLFFQDALDGNSGNDLLPRAMTPGCAEMGTPADEIIFFGGSDCDSAFGLAGDDILYSYTATTTDTLMGDGGSGADYIYVLGRGVVLGYGGSEADELELSSRKDVIGSGGDDADIVKGYSYNNDVILMGDAGDDVLIGHAYHGSVYVDGGNDNDELHAIALVDTVRSVGGPGDDRIYSGSKTKKQTALGGSGNDFIYGASLTGSRNVLDGGIGDDVLVVGIDHPYSSSPGFVYKGSYLYGGPGDDLMLAHSKNDTLTGGGGMDVMRAYSGDDLLIATDNLLAEADGGPGADLLQINFSLDLDASAAILRGLERLDISGTAGNIFTVGSSTQVHDITEGVNVFTGTSSTLIVDGGPDDQVVLKGTWSSAGTGSIGIYLYDIYEAPDSARLWIAQDIAVLIGVLNPADEPALTIAPNPSHGMVQLKFTAVHYGLMKIILTDLEGRILMTSEKNIETGIFTETLDISTFPSGVYLLEMESPDYRMKRKLVKF